MRRLAWFIGAPHGPPAVRPWAAFTVAAALLGACTDDSTTVTDSQSPSSTTDTTEGPDNPTTNPLPTTTEPDTTTTTTDSTTLPVPTTTDTTDTTTTTTTTTTSTTDTTDTDTDTDSTTGDPIVGRSVTQTVNGGTVATSPNFRMVFTLGQPTQNQGVYTSTNFRLQGGLIGANGNPP
jgi:hypothetical protein